MVRISSQYLVLALSTFGLVLGAPGRRDIAKADADLVTVQTDTSTLLTAIQAFGCNTGTVAQLDVRVSFP
jgi:hypothetical protein